MQPKICIIGVTHPSANPRLVRDATALAAAGYDVVAVTTQMMPRLLADDRELQGALWRHRPVNLLDGYAARLRRHWLRVRRKATLALASRLATPGLVACACAYAGPELAARATQENADLYLAQAHGALPAAHAAASATGARLAFDAEDLLAECESEPLEVMQFIERQLVPDCDLVCTMSKAASLRFQQRLGLLEAPLVLQNTPHLTERAGIDPPVRRPANTPPRIYWFGQTLGRHACADQVLRALPLLHIPACLVLRGHADPAAVAELDQLARDLGVRDRLELHPRAKPTDMVRLAADCDVLLGSQPGQDPFHQMAVGNKVFTGLMAGLMIALTDTTAHRLLMADLSGCAFLFPDRDHRALAKQLNPWIAHPERLLNARQTAWEISERKFNWERESQALITRVANLIGSPAEALAA